MDIDLLWEDVLKLKETITEVIHHDVLTYRPKKRGVVQADIEDYTLMMLIWAADYAARQENKQPLTNELMRRFIDYGLYMQRQAVIRNTHMPPYTPEMIGLLYAEFAQTLERTFPVRNQSGFAFFQHTIGRLSFPQTFKDFSRGMRYKRMIENGISFFIKFHFGPSSSHD